jgi:hypothetical protein
MSHAAQSTRPSLDPPRYTPDTPDSADAPPVARCAECEATLIGPYCHACGQPRRRPDDLTLRRFLRAGAHEVSGVDTKLVRSLAALVRHPGRLTREFLAGRRGRWVGPLQLYLLVSATFFLVGGMQVYVDRAGMERQVRQAFAQADVIGTRVLGRAMERKPVPSLATGRVVEDWVELLGYAKFGVVAVTALLVWAVQRRRMRGGGLPHVVFALHYEAFSYLLSLALAPAWWWYTRYHGQPSQWAGGLLLVGPSALYMWHALRTAYDEPGVRALFKTVLIVGLGILVGGFIHGGALGIALARAQG